MINYNITKVDTFETIFTAEIDCEESAPTYLKKRLAIVWLLRGYNNHNCPLTDRGYFDPFTCRFE